MVGFIAIALMSGARSEAYLMPIAPQEMRSPVGDELKRCDEPVRNAIARVRQSPHWGNFHFDCGSGTVMRIQASRSSKIVRSWPQFVRENADMFGIDPRTVRVGPRDGPIETVYQSFGGMKIVPLLSFQPHAYRAEKSDLIIRTDFVKTNGWRFTTSVSSQSAVAIVQHDWARTGEKASVKGAELMIILNEPFGEQCDFKLPSPVWVIHSTDRTTDCHVDAVTGKLCEPCPACRDGCSF